MMNSAKITSILFGILIIYLINVGILNAQNRIEQHQQVLTEKGIETPLSEDFNKSVSNISLLTQDFSSTTFPPSGWTMNIVTGTLGWSRGVGPQTYATFSTINTTAANGYAIVNSDGCGGLCGSEQTILKTPAVNCIGHSYVWLKFNNYFIQFGNSTAVVEVSNDNNNWIAVHSAHTGLAQNQATPNPQFVDVNISPYAANQATVYVRFKWTGNYDYYWFVDDVEIYSKNPYDVALHSAVNPNEYSVVPFSHYNGNTIPLTATAKNVGGAGISGVKVNFKIYNSTNNNLLHSAQSNTSGPVLAGSTVDLTASPFTIPQTPASYKIEYIVSMMQQDSNSSNDTLYRYFSITDTIYARDEAYFTNTLDGSLGIAAGGTAHIGQNFTLTTADKLSRVRFYVTGPAVGDSATMYLYSTLPDGTPSTVLAQSTPYIFTVAGAQWITLQFSTGTLSLNAGTYCIALLDHHTTDNIGLGYNDRNFTPSKAWVKVNANAWQKTEDLGFPCSYVIRPYFVCAGYKPFIQPSTNAAFCTGASTTLTASQGTAYLWSPGGQTTQSINVNTTGLYSVSVTNNYGCSGVSDNVSVSQLPNPVVNLGNDTTICGFLMLNAGPAFANYSWSGGTSNTQYLTASSTGLYTVVVTDSLGCVGIDSIHVIVQPGPTVNLGQDLVLCDYETAVLNAGQGFTSYMWSNQSTNQILTLTSAIGLGTHEFSVVVTDANQCVATDTINVTFQTCVGIEFNKDAELTMFPNPANDFVTVTFPSNMPSKALFEVFDIYGKKVISQIIDEHTQTKTFNIKSLKSGLYIMLLTTNSNQYNSKLIIK